MNFRSKRAAEYGPSTALRYVRLRRANLSSSHTYGCNLEWSPWFYDWAFNYRREDEAQSMFLQVYAFTTRNSLFQERISAIEKSDILYVISMIIVAQQG